MQPEFDFQPLPAQSVDGIELWRQRRHQEQVAIAKKLGLPLGQMVEVWLRGGIRLRGRLGLRDAALIHSDGREAQFAVDGTPFVVDEMESCARI